MRRSLGAGEVLEDRDLLADFLAVQRSRGLACGDGAEALRIFARQPIQLALVDQRMPGMDGVALIAALKGLNPLVTVFMITAYGAVAPAVQAMKQGADDFLEKPVDLGVLMEKLEALDQRLAMTAEAEEASGATLSGPLAPAMVGESDAMREVLSLVRRVAETPWAVLVRGETGTGKE